MDICSKQWSGDSTFDPKAALQKNKSRHFWASPEKIQQGLPPLDQFCSGLCLIPLTKINLWLKQLYIGPLTESSQMEFNSTYISKVNESIPSHIGSKVPLALGKSFSSHCSDHLSNTGNKNSHIPWKTGCLMGVYNNPYYNKGIENPHWNQPALLHCSCWSIMPSETKTKHHYTQMTEKHNIQPSILSIFPDAIFGGNCWMTYRYLGHV